MRVVSTRPVSELMTLIEFPFSSAVKTTPLPGDAADALIEPLPALSLAALPAPVPVPPPAPPVCARAKVELPANMAIAIRVCLKFMALSVLLGCH